MPTSCCKEAGDGRVPDKEFGEHLLVVIERHHAGGIALVVGCVDVCTTVEELRTDRRVSAEGGPVQCSFLKHDQNARTPFESMTNPCRVLLLHIHRLLDEEDDCIETSLVRGPHQRSVPIVVRGIDISALGLQIIHHHYFA